MQTELARHQFVRWWCSPRQRDAGLLRTELGGIMTSYWPSIAADIEAALAEDELREGLDRQDRSHDRSTESGVSGRTILRQLKRRIVRQEQVRRQVLAAATDLIERAAARPPVAEPSYEDSFVN